MDCLVSFLRASTAMSFLPGFENQDALGITTDRSRELLAADPLPDTALDGGQRCVSDAAMSQQRPKAAGPHVLIHGHAGAQPQPGNCGAADVGLSHAGGLRQCKAGYQRTARPQKGAPAPRKITLGRGIIPPHLGASIFAGSVKRQRVAPAVWPHGRGSLSSEAMRGGNRATRPALSLMLCARNQPIERLRHIVADEECPAFQFSVIRIDVLFGLGLV